jgi:hypothetical protein|tara:strand:+ start:10713 stop:10937 length:225 start_codon:yes stop_codon:yes gene_type:complete
MIQEVAKELLKVVNDKKTMDALEKYMNYRVEELHKLLEQQDKISDINKAQGAIKELRRIKTLREEVIAKARNGA